MAQPVPNETGGGLGVRNPEYLFAPHSVAVTGAAERRGEGSGAVPRQALGSRKLDIETGKAALPRSALAEKGYMMFYKTILVHVDTSGHLMPHIEVAAKLAVRAKAHLVGVAATGIPHLRYGAPAAGPVRGDGAASSSVDQGGLHQGAKAALDRFETLARALGATSCAQRLIDDDAAVAVGRQGLYADLIVLAQGDSGAGSRAACVDFPQYVVLNSACPVLIVPRAGGGAGLGERALVGWNGSRAAARALRNAIPLLQQATSVQLAVIDASTAPVQLDGESSADLIAFLSRHGIAAEVVRRTEQDDAGHGLLSLAADLGCDMLVMGCVAHPRTRSFVLGGATRVALQSATIPVLMSH